jgi:hypothetical protein
MPRARAEDLHPAELDLQKDGTYPDKDGSPDVQILQRECQASTYNHSLPHLVVQALAGILERLDVNFQQFVDHPSPTPSNVQRGFGTIEFSNNEILTRDV